MVSSNVNLVASGKVISDKTCKFLKPVFVDAGFLVVGSRVSKVSVSRLRVCPYFKQVLYGYASSHGDYACMNLCSLSSVHCDFGGVRYKFKSRVGGFFTVFWVCPRIVALVVPK